ncbi:alpha/beta fold hydrolase [Ahrensia sp. 13_GOM-1096m]|uniref:alpha/beta fold hydrolase n=1 Tax=Ahrensia sp. 13_GOM-1096m TaxID=1380380 RepID=UPI000687E6E1|nr:alpha/beta hydrolase [Ahrensia sp. 13_GOM-1096m]
MTNSAVQCHIESRFYTSRDGLRLHACDYVPFDAAHEQNLPVICMHGLSRNARDFDLLAKYLASHPQTPRRVIAFDYRGRGLSEYDKNWSKYNVLTEAEDIVSGLNALGIEHGIFIGTSRGGLITFVLAGMRPTALKGIVLNDIGPVIDGAGLMQIRSYLQQAPRPKNWSEAIEAQRKIMGKSFPALTDEDWLFEVECRYSQKDGILSADYDPHLADTMKGLNAGDRLPTAWPQFIGLRHLPTLVIRGENSNILSKETFEQMSAVHPKMQQLHVEGQGHAPMLHTSGLDDAIAQFCAKI